MFCKFLSDTKAWKQGADRDDCFFVSIFKFADHLLQIGSEIHWFAVFDGSIGLSRAPIVEPACKLLFLSKRLKHVDLFLLCLI